MTIIEIHSVKEYSPACHYANDSTLLLMKNICKNSHLHFKRLVELQKFEANLLVRWQTLWFILFMTRCYNIFGF